MPIALTNSLPPNTLPHSSTLLASFHRAEVWERDVFPIGNGRLGATLSGGPTEVMQINEETVWGGVVGYDNERMGVANNVADYSMSGFGSYLSTCALIIETPEISINHLCARWLDVTTGIHRSVCEGNGVRIQQESFASGPADVIVHRIMLSQPSLIVLRLETEHQARTWGCDFDLATGITALLPNGLEFTAGVQVMEDFSHFRTMYLTGVSEPTSAKSPSHPQGTSGTSGPPYPSIRVEDCTELCLAINVATNYSREHAAPNPTHSTLCAWRRSTAPLRHASYTDLRASHLADMHEALGSTSLHLGDPEEQRESEREGEGITERHGEFSRWWSAPAKALDTAQRLHAYARGARDSHLEALAFHYGRYLLVSSSRPGTLPANLQGVWNHSNTPAWGSDYHSNINLQMAYWAAESTNLSPSHTALFDFLERMTPFYRAASSKKFEGAPGWTCRTSQSIFGGHCWEWNTVASAWYALHFIEHWRYSPTPSNAERAWRFSKDVCEFWLSRLIEVPAPDGGTELLAPEGWSPEHGPREDGVAYDQQILRELFHFAAILGRLHEGNSPLVRAIDDAIPRLGQDRIGRWNQLQEWREDRDDPADHHRHTSNLFAAYPGTQITTATPDLAKAALTSLRARCNALRNPVTADAVRGDSVRSWTWAWRGAIFARLSDGDAAYEMLRGQLSRSTLPNLWTTHPPFQIDGSLGFPAVISEMLLASHEDIIHIAPALPSEWKSGNVRGLRARGGFTVTFEWADGFVTRVRIDADNPDLSHIRIRANNTIHDISLGYDHLIGPHTP